MSEESYIETLGRLYLVRLSVTQDIQDLIDELLESILDKYGEERSRK